MDRCTHKCAPSDCGRSACQPRHAVKCKQISARPTDKRDLCPEQNRRDRCQHKNSSQSKLKGSRLQGVSLHRQPCEDRCLSAAHHRLHPAQTVLRPKGASWTGNSVTTDAVGGNITAPAPNSLQHTQSLGLTGGRRQLHWRPCEGRGGGQLHSRTDCGGLACGRQQVGAQQKLLEDLQAQRQHLFGQGGQATKGLLLQGERKGDCVLWIEA